MATFTDFKVLLDDPADAPGLRFDEYASALTEMILHSRAEFAVGIFGSWGSGKTTLMRAIKRHLDGNAAVVPVWFTAWRYEREPHLIVPLLDVLREALDKLARAQAVPQSPARRAAAAIARTGRAFLAGLTLSAGPPGLTANWEPDKTIAALKADDSGGTESLSFYQAAFVMLRDAIKEFSAGGARRVVVFVDDLDRCLPSNALDVLESMKLFFDFEGFVFVVGLDQTVAERAVALKYPSSEGAAAQPPVSGTEYVKKIFQVPFTLPRISTDQLQDYLTTVAANAALQGAQLTDFDQNVRRHLEFLPGEDSVNPREVKRLINTYTLQLKMLGPRLGDDLDPNVVLALQCMTFRPDWRDLYESLAADPQLFQSTLRSAVGEHEPPDAMWLSGLRVALPAQFLQYVNGHAKPLLNVQDLPSYVSAAEFDALHGPIGPGGADIRQPAAAGHRGAHGGRSVHRRRGEAAAGGRAALDGRARSNYGLWAPVGGHGQPARGQGSRAGHSRDFRGSAARDREVGRRDDPAAGDARHPVARPAPPDQRRRPRVTSGKM